MFKNTDARVSIHEHSDSAGISPGSTSSFLKKRQGLNRTKQVLSCIAGVSIPAFILHTQLTLSQLRAILNKSWRQHPTRHQLYGHLPPITKTIKAKRTRHAGHCWKSKDDLKSDELPHMTKQKQED